ncbi:MAG: ABC transporter ATP-binding protein [Trueperaceae bacterium]|nr:MAG: ABC transporter ATP-binding protein [Trueperaceae bacterium]
MPLLEITNLESGYFKQRPILRGISITVESGRCVAVLGSNGAGKSTLLKTIMGLIEDEPRRGEIRLEGEPLQRYRTERIARSGVAYVVEGRGMFPQLTVLESLQLGAYHRRNRSEVQHDLEGVYQLFPRLQERKHQVCGTMSGGEQQMLAIARAMMSRPRLILLDEPSLGLAPLLIEEIFWAIHNINQHGTGILLVEQNAMQALGIADYGYVMESGRIVLQGTPDELNADRNVQELYLGQHHTDEGGVRLHVRRRRRRWS